MNFSARVDNSGHFRECEFWGTEFWGMKFSEKVYNHLDHLDWMNFDQIEWIEGYVLALSETCSFSLSVIFSMPHFICLRFRFQEKTKEILSKCTQKRIEKKAWKNDKNIYNFHGILGEGSFLTQAAKFIIDQKSVIFYSFI